MSFFVSGQPLTKWYRMSGNTEEVVFTAQKRTTILSMRFKHSNTSGTPTLTILRDDGANDFYFRNAEAISAAKETVVFDEVFALNAGDSIKATSGAVGGDFHVRLVYLAPDALASR